MPTSTNSVVIGAPILARPKKSVPVRKWYFSLSEASIDRKDHGWRGLTRVAVISALRNTSLQPHMIYDGEESEFTAELRSMGVKIIPHRVSFYDKLVEASPSRTADYLGIALGVFPRVEIPWIEQEDEFVLFTDCDVMFLGEPNLEMAPRYFAAAPQTSKTDYDQDMNAGVMLMNVPNLRKDLPDFIKFITENLPRGWPGCDQENYRRYYHGKWDRLDLTSNWKPYWSYNSEARIVHWHGPKPQIIRRLLTEKALETVPSWRNLFERDIESYKTYIDIWDDFQIDTRDDVTGHLDILTTDGGGGWAICPDKPSLSIKLSLFLDDAFFTTVVCDGPRPDIKAAYGVEGAGFSFALPTTFNDGRSHKIELRDRLGFPVALKMRDNLSTIHWFGPSKDAPGLALCMSKQRQSSAIASTNVAANSRLTRFSAYLNKAMRVIEIGPSHKPFAPKADGWDTVVVDHTDESGLKKKYSTQVDSVSKIEAVDIIWSGGNLAEKFPKATHGTFDAVVASHVLEHLPDPISFLQSCEVLLKNTGSLLLALPDKRHCFDFFGQLTFASDWLTAYDVKAVSHSKRSAFNHVAYAVKNAGQLAWGNAEILDISLVHTLDQAASAFNMASDQGDGTYFDYHAWRFTPSSFRLLILETAYIADLNLRLVESSELIGHEFFAIVSMGRGEPESVQEREAHRLMLLKQIIQETACQA